MADLYRLSQYFLTTLSVAGGIDASQTTDIVLQAVTGIDEPTKPGIALLNYSDPLETSACEWITYTSVNTTTKELQGVARGQEDYSAKAHANGVTVAFPLSKSHINNIVDKLEGLDTGVTLDQPTLTSPTVTTPEINEAVALTATSTELNLLDGVTSLGLDGWIPATDTWTYASATTFTIAGVDRTAMFPKGTKIKLTQTTAKYFYVVGSAFSTDTTITVTGGSDYTLANAAITSPNYSYASSPQGFPNAFNWSPTLGGWSSAPSGGTYAFSMNGKVVHVSILQPNDGTANATTRTITVPVAATFQSIAPVFMHDNGAALVEPGFAIIAAGGGTTITIAKNFGYQALTASGASRIKGLSMTYIA